MKVFITGEAGLIAQRLEHELMLTGNDVVWGYSHRDLSRCRFRSVWNYDVELDVCDYEVLKRTIKETNPDIVIHTGGYVGTEICELYPKEAAISNVYGSHNVAKVCEELNKYLVYFSTTAIFDPDDYEGNIITLQTAKNPKTIYGVTKYAGELTCSKVSRLTVLRPCFVYGGKNDFHSAIAKLIKTGFTHRKEIILLDPAIKKDYLYIDDFVAALMVILLTIKKQFIKEKQKYEFHISYGEPILFGDVIRKIEDITGLKLVYELRPNCDYLKNHIVSNDSVLALGWKPNITLEEGIKRSFLEIKEFFDGQYRQFKGSNGNVTKSVS